MKVGMASIDITPKESIMLVGYAARTEPSRGVVHPIYARAIAFEDQTGQKKVLITADLIGFSRNLSDEISLQVEKEFNIPRECLIFSASHTHTAPLLNCLKLQMYVLTGSQQKTIDDYTQFLKESLLQVIRLAINDLAPANLTFGSGQAEIGINRRAFTSRGVIIGINPDGPVDTQVPVLAISDTNRQLSGVLFGFACHGTTLGGSDYYQVCGDYMGFAREYLELSQKNIITFFTPGCSADINPYPRGTLHLARLHGLRLAGAVASALKPDMLTVDGPIRCLLKTVELPFSKIPSTNDFKERLKDENLHVQRHARYFLDLLEKEKVIPKTCSYPIQVWQFGKDLTLIALGGEVVVDYALRLKRELKNHNVWMIANANDDCGYIGSARTLYEGGYEADNSTIYYFLPSRWDFQVEEIIISTVKEMIASVDSL
ncbi:neutral/alkaline non-lysosomal ceramidase N-terminal domain-containing protein [candidate division KSB1 bacterium]|nr:neutral/alkaline non-lysosomal ceramidase N-terminal domain-containing protein [candidate division KSB1 bacterium]